VSAVSTPDLSALPASEAWAYFGSVEAAALLAARARMGAEYEDETTYPDADLKTAITAAVTFFESATGRFFVKRTGSVLLDGSGSVVLLLPGSLPIVSVGQGGDSITAVELDGVAVTLTDLTINDGAGHKPRDPRDAPYLELTGEGDTTRWTPGHRIVELTGDFGYLDSSGDTPELVRDAVARLTIRGLVPLDDEDAQEDQWRGSLVTEQTQGRSYTKAAGGRGGGLTTDKRIDSAIVRFKAPSRAPKSPGMGRHRRRSWWSRRR